MVAIIGTIGLVVLVVIGTAVGVTLFFRRNPNKQAQVNKAVDQASTKL